MNFIKEYSVSTKIYFSAAVLGVTLIIVLGGFFVRNQFFSDQPGAVAGVSRSRFDFSAYQESYPNDFTAYGPILPQLPPLPSAALPSGSDTPALSVPVLLYHGILAKHDGTRTNMSYETFKEQMIALKAGGYQTISIDEFYQFITGKIDVPEKSILITFDDGRKDTFYPADTLLDALGFRATMFVITDQVSPFSDYYLSLDELQELRESGRWDIQSHGRYNHDLISIDAYGAQGHFLSNLAWLSDKNRRETMWEYESRIYNDLLSSREFLAQNLNDTIIGFAFPYGDFGQETSYKDTTLASVSSIYPLAFYQVWERAELNYPQPEKDLVMVKRISPQFDWSGKDLVEYLASGEAVTLPYYARNNEYREWASTWGNLSRDAHRLTLQATSDTTGAAALMNGAEHLRDYTFRAHTQPLAGTSVSLFAKYQDNQSNLSCTFNNTSVRLSRMQNGREEIITSWNYQLPQFVNSWHMFGIAVHGPDVRCLYGSQTLVEGTLFDMASIEGGVLLSIWDDTPGIALASIDSISIEAEEPADSYDLVNDVYRNDNQRTALYQPFESGDLVLIVDGKQHRLLRYSILNEYGLTESDIQRIDSDQLDLFPPLSLAQKPGQMDVYYLFDELGIKIRIPTLEVFRSYAHNRLDDIRVLAPRDIDSYADAELVKVAGDSEIYALSSNRAYPVPPELLFEDPRFDWRRVAIINEEHLSHYTR